MKKNFLSFIKNYWILLLFLSTFSFFILPSCFQNNESLNIVSAEHIDSGSIIGSILQMNSRHLPNSFYNQNIPYHTGYYGFPYNSIVFWTIKITKIPFRSYINNNFYVYPLIAKLLNFVFASLSIIYLYKLSTKILKYNLSKIILLLLVIIFPEFLHYTFHIKPDILGLLFSLISLNYLYDFLQKPKNTKNIIKANIFGGLSILCKQPHVFIIFPLFLGFVFTLKGSCKEKLSKFINVYFYSGIIFLFLFFIIHPYAFLESKAFLARQISMTSMTSAPYMENLNYWIPSFLHSSYLFVVAFIPLFFMLLNMFKKFHNRNTYFLGLISFYLVVFVLWLSFKTGPIRTIAYLIPVFSLSLLIFVYLFDLFLHQIFVNKNKIIKISCLFIIFLFIIYTINLYKFNIFYKTPNRPFTSKYMIQSAFLFKKTATYQSTKTLEKEFQNQQLNKKTIIYSTSLPVNDTLYENATTTWQLPTEQSINDYKPDFLFMDLTVYWEKPYEYWKKIAQENKLNKEKLFIENIPKEKNIILFYQ